MPSPTLFTITTRTNPVRTFNVTDTVTTVGKADRGTATQTYKTAEGYVVTDGGDAKCYFVTMPDGTRLDAYRD